MKTAYPTIMGTCDIYLYANVPFDNSYAHHTLISKKFTYNNSAVYTASDETYGLACERFLNRRDPDDSDAYYYPRWKITGEFNFNFSNGLIASVVLELTPAQTNANYLKLVRGSDIYYYFITGISQVNFDTYNLSLELDVIMTYQDEFLDGMKDVPVFTERKHCHRYTNNGIYPHCADFKTGDSTFAGVKPSVIKNRYQTYLTGELYKLRDLQWLYICTDGKDASSGATTPFNVDTYYKYDGLLHPLAMLVVPLGCNDMIFSDGTNTATLNHSSIINLIHSLVGSGTLHACKLSPYPPFKSSTMTITKDGSNNYTITDTPTKMKIQDDGSGSHNNVMYTNSKTKIFACGIAPAYHIPVIIEEYRSDFESSTISLTGLKNITNPTITSSRYEDPKLLFSPFKKYTLNATYGEGYEFYPELLYSDGVFKNVDFSFTTIYTCYIGDYNISTYLDQKVDANGNYFFTNYRYVNNGLSSNVNYNIPIGQDALASFNLTQGQSFYQSKIASGITSGVTIAGGIGSVMLGVAGENPLLIGAGATAIAGGFASMVNTIKSTSAKIEDLQNTPDSINVTGSCYVNDHARHDNQMPFVVEYEVTQIVKNNADEFFYHYGYEMARECYFNKELYYDNDVTRKVDNNIFGRTLFNYVKLNEDITNKIDADIPYIVKKKLSSIFNDGITIWTFFGFQQFWRSRKTPSAVGYKVENFFMRETYDNTEYQGTMY